MAKVVVIVGPVGDHNAHYKADANDIVDRGERYTSNVVKLFTPNATWSKVKAALQGANVVVYLGHGNGWPSIYAPFQTRRRTASGSIRPRGADGNKVVYYGEDYLRGPRSASRRTRSCSCTTSATPRATRSPGSSQGTFTQAKERVDNYGAGFIGAGARAVFAEGHPAHPATNYIRQLFTTSRTMDRSSARRPRGTATWPGRTRRSGRRACATSWTPTRARPRASTGRSSATSR